MEVMLLDHAWNLKGPLINLIINAAISFPTSVLCHSQCLHHGYAADAFAVWLRQPVASYGGNGEVKVQV